MLSRKTSINPFPFGIHFVMFVFNNVRLGHSENPVCWPFNIVPYKIHPDFSLYQQNYIKQQIGKINDQTCIYWSDMDETDSLQNQTSFVSFEKGIMNGVCEMKISYRYSSGEMISMEPLVLLTDRCFKRGYVLHEIVHALGFDHEHQRLDRDCYVWVSDRARLNSNYQIKRLTYIPNIDRFPYDKTSIMHYRRSGDLKAKSERFYEWEPMGNKEATLSYLDLWKIQYRFCGRPHYCEVHPQQCRDMEREESEKNCNVSPADTN